MAELGADVEFKPRARWQNAAREQRKATRAAGGSTLLLLLLKVDVNVGNIHISSLLCFIKLVICATCLIGLEYLT